MAATDKMEQMFLDGSHPALHRDAHAASTLRAGSPPLASAQQDSDGAQSADEDEDDVEEARFSAIDPDPPTRDGQNPPLRESTNNNHNSRNAMSRRRGEESRNTGVKGVRADYAEAMARQQQPTKQLTRKMEKNLSLRDDHDRDEEEADELTLLRRRRLAELQGSGERGANGLGAGGPRLFGHLSEVGFEGFVSAVEDEDPETAVVVHLYEPDIPTCALLNAHLATLARLHPSTKFLRALASELDFMQPSSLSEANSADADATLPTVLVYRAGELETTWVRFDFELPAGRVVQGEEGRRQVEEVLLNAGVIVSSSSSFGSNGIVSTGPRTVRAVARRTGQASDDDDE
ncbi:hypothetical protein JCM10908_007264 [Rhodotorula pacifica]|uniref:uncharacterized protein n=1 Tax=Rhodotorula pacifica TaxID=1495444 RepID=UPI003181A817